MDRKAWEIVRSVNVLFPTAKILGEGRFKVVFSLDQDRVLKISKTEIGAVMERETYEKIKKIPGLKEQAAWTLYLSSRVQLQQRTKPCRMPKTEIKKWQGWFRPHKICDIRRANIGLGNDGKHVLIDWLPHGWKEREAAQLRLQNNTKPLVALQVEDS